MDLVAALPRPARTGVRWTTPDQWHVTLRFLGQVPDVVAVEDVLGRIAAGAADPVGAADAHGSHGGSVVASAGPSVGRLGSSVLCVPVAGLDDVAGSVMALTAALGQPADFRPFHGHLTLARGRRGIDLRPLAGTPFSAVWSVDEVTLVASQLHSDAARYEVIGRFPLGVPRSTGPPAADHRR